MDIPPLRGRQLAALRSVAGAPHGLRTGAFPTSMRLLAEMGLVEERAAPRAWHAKGRAWFLTADGRATMREYGADEA